MAAFEHLPPDVYALILAFFSTYPRLGCGISNNSAHALSLCKSIASLAPERWLPGVWATMDRDVLRVFVMVHFCRPPDYPRWPDRILPTLRDALGGLDFVHSAGTPLLHAVRFRNRRTVDLLITTGVNVDRAYWVNRTPLWHCGEHGDEPALLGIAEALIAAGADLNVQDDVGKDTPLNMAVYHRQYKMALLLIAAGADVFACDRGGRGPYYYAMERGGTDDGSFDVVEALEAKGETAARSIQARRDARAANHAANGPGGDY